MKSIKAFEDETMGPITMPGISKELPQITSNGHQISDKLKKQDLKTSSKLVLLQQFVIQQCYPVTQESPNVHSERIITDLLSNKYFLSKAIKDSGKLL